ncbi:unnamed protein product, partial [Iphiclides podalirius]
MMTYWRSYLGSLIRDVGIMESFTRKMRLSCLIASTLLSIAMSAGEEYLPPSKGYIYKPPRIPFNTPTRPPPPPPKTTPQQPHQYLPPVSTSPPFVPKPVPVPTPVPHDMLF